MEEEEIDPIPLIADAQAALAADEREVTAKLEQKGFEVVDEGLLQVTLGLLVLETEELQDKGIADLFISCQGVAGLGLRALGEHASLFAGEGGAFVQLRGDLAVELPDRPAASEGLGFIELAGLSRAGPAEKMDVMGP